MSVRFGKFKRLHLAALLLLCVLPPSKLAYGAKDPLETSESVVVVLVGDATRQAVEPATNAWPTPPGISRQIEIYPSDAASWLLGPLRRRLIPERQAAIAREAALCRPGAPLFSELVTQADGELAFVQTEAAAALLARAKTAYSCGIEVASERLLGKFLVVSSLLRLYEGKDPSTLLEDALTVDPDLPPPEDLDDKVQTAYRRAQKRQLSRARVTVELALDKLAGLKLLIDGVAPRASKVGLLEGQHFLQLVGSDGRAVAGKRVRISLASPPESRRWPPAELEPPSEAKVLAKIRGELIEGNLGPELQEVLLHEMEARSISAVILVAPIEGSEELSALYLLPSGAVDTRRISPPARAAKRSSWLLPGLLGVGAAASGTYYGYTYFRLANGMGDGTFQDEASFNAVRTGGVAAGIVSLSCLAGAVASAVVPRVRHGQASRAYRADERVAESERRSWLRVTLEPGGAALSLMGRW